MKNRTLNSVKYPLVSAYWVTGFRSDYLAISIDSFLKSTNYPNLEIIVVDFSIGENGILHRENLNKLNTVNKFLFREEINCMWSNSNLAFENTHGDFILHFEDDVQMVENTPINWVEDSCKLLDPSIQNGIGAINLFASNPDHPQSVAFMSTRNVRDMWHPWPCYPNDFPTVTESMLSGDRIRINRFFELGYRVVSKPYVVTSLNAPSVNLVKIQHSKKLTFQETDKLVMEGFTSQRDADTKYISGPEYSKKAGWRGFNLSLIHPVGFQELIVSKKSVRFQRFKSLLRRFLQL
jgi:hypothetical protein